MLWATEEAHPGNHFEALIQLKSPEKRLEIDVVLNEKYQKAIDDDLAKGHIFVVRSYDLSKRTNRKWYLPHHPVVNPRTTLEIVRRILNGASKCQKQYLNSAFVNWSRPIAEPFTRFDPFPRIFIHRILRHSNG